uniref:serine/arginine repetitive matrix protein 1 isoform X3 n=1 Tax=Ciona intestinalis TaxID=7719 RepID=UPI000EF4B598|nr:serine/arginine repetitive matrix protein 1 isoform X3 [Ciona intestinalis]|eukprot:XP_026690232.1 serine/arginine repetitive matrix protein 1 isoform X3 [Ciona intestinalis]
MYFSKVGNRRSDIGKDAHKSSLPYILLEEQEHYIVCDMSRSPPPPAGRPWYTSQPNHSGGAPAIQSSTERRSPVPDRGPPPPDWYRWQEYYRGRSPPRNIPPRSHSPNRAPSPDHKRSNSPRNDRSTNQRVPSPRQERPASPRERMPPRPPSPRRERPPSPRRERPPSPRRERPPSPRRERPPSPRRERPPSPRRERPRSPPDWRRRSPGPYYRGPPSDWRRSPPHWARRSPPRYGPPRGRSPPRGHWGPPPPEWDRYRGPPPPDRRSPPRWAPSSHSYDKRWPPPPAPAPPKPDAPAPPTQVPAPATTTVSPVPSPQVDANKPEATNKAEETLVPPGEEKEEVIENFDLPEYDAEVPLGQKYVIPVSGFFCKICHKFYNTESSAKITHCKSKTHYDKFAKWLSEKKVASITQKRSASVSNTNSNDGEPPNKQVKVEIKMEPQQDEAKYDPTNPTAVEPAEQKEEIKSLISSVAPGQIRVTVTNTQVNTQNENDSDTKEVDMDEGEQDEDSTMNESSVALLDSTPLVDENSTPVLDDNGENGSINQSSDYDAETDQLITNDVKKDNSVDCMEATLYNLRKLKVAQLKSNLEKRGIKSTGLKTLLIKRLEKVLLEEAAASENEENNKEEEENDEIGGGENEDEIVENEAEESRDQILTLKMIESDVEASNKKEHWITERELERELLALEGVKQVNKLTFEKYKVGKKTVVEWTISVNFDGEMSEDGLFFFMPSHQQLSYKATLENEA